MGLKDIADAASRKYTKLGDDYPEAKLAADLFPGTGVVTSIADTANDVYKGNYVDAGLDLLGVIPGGKLIKGFRDIKDKSKYVGKRFDTARNIDRGLDTATYVDKKEPKKEPKKEVKKETKKPARADYPDYYNYKKGGKVKIKSTASSRGDGCAQRGKTRGKLR